MPRPRARPRRPGATLSPQENRVKKLKLTVEALAVDSFATGNADGPIGTVQGQEFVPTSPHPTCGPATRLTDCPCTPAY